MSVEYHHVMFPEISRRAQAALPRQKEGKVKQLASLPSCGALFECPKRGFSEMRCMESHRDFQAGCQAGRALQENQLFLYNLCS